jgi:hypothetical protein
MRPLSSNLGAIKKKKTFLESNENSIDQDLWDTAKAVLRGTFITMSAYLKNNQRDLR